MHKRDLCVFCTSPCHRYFMMNCANLSNWVDPGARVYARSSGKNSTKSDWLFSTRYFIIALFWLVGINFAHFYDDKTDETHTSCVVHCSFVAFVFSLKNTSYCCLFFISNLAQGRTLVWRALANSNMR